MPLYKYALKGDWEAAEQILEKDRTLLSAGISRGWDTVLHIAAGARHVRFVEKLAEIMDKEHLEIQDKNGNTALCIAAAAGAVEIVEILIKHNDSLLTRRGSHKMAPPYMAAVLGQSEMAWYLYPKSKKMLEKTDLENLFFSCINNGLYGRHTKELMILFLLEPGVHQMKLLFRRGMGGCLETSSQEIV